MSTESQGSKCEEGAGQIPLKHLVSHIVSMIETNNQDTGKHGNTRWRMTGAQCGTDIDGILELADAKLFDRWANSSFLHFNVKMSIWEEADVNEIVERLFSVYG